MVLPLFIGYNLINPLIRKPNVASITFMVVAGDSETPDLYPPGILNQLYDKIDLTSTQCKSKARLLLMNYTDSLETEGFGVCLICLISS